MTDSRRDFLKKSALLSGAAGLSTLLPASIQKAMAINPAPGSTFLDAEHIVILMQENRSFDHCFGALQGVRGFNDPRAVILPDGKPVWCQTDKQGKTFAPFRFDMKGSKVTWMGSLPHSRASQVDAYNEGKYDKWLLAKKSGNKDYAAMPLTLGYFSRQDIPFNYAMADAFTVCDQNFCSAMTSTTPNRSFFWTGKITHEDNGDMKAHIRNDNYSYAKLGWKTFPELLSENKVDWKFYQNEISCGGGFKGEERAWLANFGCNLLEFFAAYNVKFSKKYIESLVSQVETLPGEINKLQEASPSSEEAARKNQVALGKKLEALDNAASELKKWNKESYAQLTPEQKALYDRAFVVNAGDPDYRNVTTFKYKDGGAKREVTVPAGDLFHQFRKDVNEGKLPTVSWLAGPQNFSDHPSAPWYGAWYVSEVLDILTNNEEVWKKTIFILTYDENDGYYDHVVPYSIHDEKKPGTGAASAGIATELEHVRLEAEIRQGVPEKGARGGAVGLGFRVPMVIASPWSRGGKVCSEIYDHTSTIQFLETFVNNKYKKNIHMDNISAWRRTICGDLTAAFSPYDASVPRKLPFLEQQQMVENIYNAKFKDLPAGFQQLNDAAVKQISEKGLRLQEPGVRPSCALPYELYADARVDSASGQLYIDLKAGNKFFGNNAAGSPFTVYTTGAYEGNKGRNWSFAVKAGDALNYKWALNDFDGAQYELHLQGPNGFFRQFNGDKNDPGVQVQTSYETAGITAKPTGNALLKLVNNSGQPRTVTIADNAYGNKSISRTLAANATEQVVLPLGKSHGWYDFTVRAEGFNQFAQRFAGRVETGKESVTDPFMGGVA